MLERPDIPDDALIDAVQRDYGITAIGVEFLPLGYDFRAAVYRVNADGGRAYFLKIRFDALNPLSVTVPRALNAQGIAEPVAPTQPITGAAWGDIGTRPALLYPFISGRSGFEMELTPDERRRFGTALRNIHGANLPDGLAAALPRETFAPDTRISGIIVQVHALAAADTFANPYEREFAALWRAHEGKIRHVHHQHERTGAMLRENPPDFVLCHADIHTGNLMIAPDGTLHIVDWDQPKLAPKERDFVFNIGGNLDDLPPDERLFLEGYGDAPIDLRALAYYRYDWVFQDLGEFGYAMLLDATTGDETKKDSLQWFRRILGGTQIPAADALAARL